MHEAKNCTAPEFELVKKYIADFELDDRKLERQEFLTVSNGSGLLGFVRVRTYSGFSEICSLGVIVKERSQGLGKMLMAAMIEKTLQSVYLVCIIPGYFESMGFKIVNHFPPEIQDKLDYCINSLHVKEKYVVMKRQ